MATSLIVKWSNHPSRAGTPSTASAPNLPKDRAATNHTCGLSSSFMAEINRGTASPARPGSPVLLPRIIAARTRSASRGLATRARRHRAVVGFGIRDRGRLSPFDPSSNSPVNSSCPRDFRNSTLPVTNAVEGLEELGGFTPKYTHTSNVIRIDPSQTNRNSKDA